MTLNLFPHLTVGNWACSYWNDWHGSLSRKSWSPQTYLFQDDANTGSEALCVSMFVLRKRLVQLIRLISIQHILLYLYLYQHINLLIILNISKLYLLQITLCELAIAL